MAAADVSLTLSSGLKAKLSALPHLTGETLTAADLAGKITIVSFFASWCPPCNAEFRHLAELREHYGDTLTIVSVNVFEDYGGFKDRGARLRRPALVGGHRGRQRGAALQGAPGAGVQEPEGAA